MGVPDKSQKMLLNHVEEFAEVFSVFALKNRIRLDPGRLCEAATEYEFLDHDQPAEFRRDVVKIYDGVGLGLIVCGFENQMSVDCRMPVRVMGYDWARYRYQLEQLKEINQKTRIAPVFSHVLNFSYKHKWHWPRSLRDLVQLPSQLAKNFQNYKIGVTNLAWLKPSQRAMLTGDFRAFIEALCEMRETGRITGIKHPVKYLDEMLALLTATTNTPFNLMDRSAFVGGKTTMCEIMDRWMNELRAEGYKNGETTGFANGQNSMAVQIYQDLGRSKAETSDYLVHTLHIAREQADKAVEQYWRS